MSAAMTSFIALNTPTLLLPATSPDDVIEAAAIILVIGN